MTFFKFIICFFASLALLNSSAAFAEEISGIPVGTIFEFKNNEPSLVSQSGKRGYLTGYETVAMKTGKNGNTEVNVINSCHIVVDNLGNLHQVVAGARATLVKNEIRPLNFYGPDVFKSFDESQELTDGSVSFLTLKDASGVMFEVQCYDHGEAQWIRHSPFFGTLKFYFLYPLIPDVDRLRAAVTLSPGNSQ